MTLKVSPSQIAAWLRCHRAWFLKSVAYAPDDAGAGGQYLMRGTMFDEVVQAWSARLPVDDAGIIAACRRQIRDPGSFTDADLEAARGLALRQLRACEHLLPLPKTAKIQASFRVAVPGMTDVYITGKPDLLQSGLVVDTKTTSDRGPGRGKDKDSPAYALTDDTIRDDVQARLYAWCVFQSNPLQATVECRWVYVTKAPAPSAWMASTHFDRRDTLAWFERTVRPILMEMQAIHTARDAAHEAFTDYGPNDVAASHSGCQRCFTKLACDQYEGVQSSANYESNIIMAFDLSKLNRTPTPAPEPPTPTPDLVEALEASIVAVAINRPAPAAPPPVMVETVGVETPSGDVLVDVTPPAPKRGRPRRQRPTEAPVGAETDAVATEAKTLAEHAEMLATALQTVRDACDRGIADLDRRIATLLAQRGQS